MKPSKLCRCCPGAPKHFKLAMASRRAALSGYQYIVNYHLLYFCIYYFLWSTPPANATWYCVRSCLCVSVCPVCALFFESLDLDLETSFVVCRYIFGISRSGYRSKIRQTSVAKYTHLRVVRALDRNTILFIMRTKYKPNMGSIISLSSSPISIVLISTDGCRSTTCSSLFLGGRAEAAWPMRWQKRYIVMGWIEYTAMMPRCWLRQTEMRCDATESKHSLRRVLNPRGELRLIGSSPQDVRTLYPAWLAAARYKRIDETRTVVCVCPSSRVAVKL